MIASILALAIGAASFQPAPAPTDSATPDAAPSAGVSTPLASASPRSTASIPAARPTPSEPVAAKTASPASYKYRFVPHQPAVVAPGQPQIFAVYLNDSALRSHGPISIKVETSPNVTKVISRSNGRQGVIPEIVPGDFEAVSTVPGFPAFASGMSVDIEFLATASDGRRTSVRVPVKLR